jgi:septal ring factor EnvC (AmiA/AmiB activator)|tara:strand:- start:539 stop:844 length:306 start_codon:yes stop_codon:yes gene_type:complete
MENIYAEYGAIGVIVFLFIALIMNLIKSQKAQNEDLDQIRQDIAKLETAVSNTMSICVKLVDRWNSSDQTRDRRHEDTIKELNDISDDLAYLKGRINGKGL